jgi:hypothetical protein
MSFFQPREDPVPAVKELRKYSGLGAFLGQVNNCNDFQSPQQQQQQVPNYEKSWSFKNYDNPNFCNICHIECTSDNALQAHLAGKQHAKKLKTLGMTENGQNLVNNAKLVVTTNFSN